jgi:hypothetical protein
VPVSPSHPGRTKDPPQGYHHRCAGCGETPLSPPYGQRGPLAPALGESSREPVDGDVETFLAQNGGNLGGRFVRPCRMRAGHRDDDGGGEGVGSSRRWDTSIWLHVSRCLSIPPTHVNLHQEAVSAADCPAPLRSLVEFGSLDDFS